MNDLADLAQIQREPFEAALLRLRKPAAPEATGFCLYCGEVLRTAICPADGDPADGGSANGSSPEKRLQSGHSDSPGTDRPSGGNRRQQGRRWCDAECRDDWERLEARRR